MENQRYPVKTVVMIACAVYRIQGGYYRRTAMIPADGITWTNKDIIKSCLCPEIHTKNSQLSPYPLPLINVTKADQEQAELLIKYFTKRLMFGAIAGDNEFVTEINSLLSTPEVELGAAGYLAYLPEMYKKDLYKRQLEACEDGYLGEPEQSLTDLDCEILRVKRSENFDAWNILAIINCKIVSWMSSKQLATGPAVIVRAKVKSKLINWDTKKPETRLNYVKAAQ